MLSLLKLRKKNVKV